jgi:hypothetical protein
MQSNFDFTSTTVFIHFDIDCIDGQLSDDLESYLHSNLINKKYKDDNIFVGLVDREWSADVIRYETSASNINANFMQQLHTDLYDCFDAWVNSMGGFDEVAV